LIVCDLDRIIIRTNFTNTTQRVETVTLDDITDPGKRALLKRVWIDPDWFRPGQTTREVTEKAAERLGQIARGLHARGVEPARAAHFLMQLLFCLVAEDIGLLPNRVFSKMVDLGARYPEQFQTQATELLTAMNGGGFVAYEGIPHVNGGLFRHVDALELTGGKSAFRTRRRRSTGRPSNPPSSARSSSGRWCRRSGRSSAPTTWGGTISSAWWTQW
jgi:hypothetical protein